MVLAPTSYAAQNRRLPARRDELSAAPSRSLATVPTELDRILRPQAAYKWLFPQLSAITPTYIESILRGAFFGSHIQQWALFDLMEDTWPRLAKDLNEIKKAVIALDWKLNPWAEEDTPPTPEALEKTKLVSNALWKMQPDPAGDENAFPQMLYDILDALAKGTSLQEILWEPREGDIMIKGTVWVRPDNYSWATDGRFGLNPNALANPQVQIENSPYLPRAYSLTADLGPRPQVIELAPDKFLLSIFKSKSGHPLGGALLRSLAWWWCAANFSADWLMNLAQVFGLPFRWANYQTGSPQATVDAICNMLTNMGSAGWGAFPEGTHLELMDAGKTGDQSPQGDLLERADKNCDLLILGQTLTTEQGSRGSQALGKVHQGVKEENIMAAANSAAEVLNRQLIPAILRLNYGEATEAPELAPAFHKEQDLVTNAQRDQILIQAGVEMPKKWFYKRHDIPLPAPGEETIGGNANENDAADSPLPSGEGQGEGGPQKRTTTRTQLQSYSAKAASSTPLEKSALHPFVAAVAQDLSPVLARLAAIHKIQDQTLWRAKLQSFLEHDFPRLLTDISQDPASARVLQETISAALANGLTQRAA